MDFCEKENVWNVLPKIVVAPSINCFEGRSDQFVLDRRFTTLLTKDGGVFNVRSVNRLYLTFILELYKMYKGALTNKQQTKRTVSN